MPRASHACTHSRAAQGAARPHVNPMVALRNIACSDRWDEAWSQIAQQLRQQDQARRAQRRQQRHVQHSCEATTTVSTTTVAVEEPKLLADICVPEAALHTHTQTALLQPTTKQPHHPPANHPWRRFTFGRARYQSPRKPTDAKS